MHLAAILYRQSYICTLNKGWLGLESWQVGSAAAAAVAAASAAAVVTAAATADVYQLLLLTSVVLCVSVQMMRTIEVVCFNACMGVCVWAYNRGGQMFVEVKVGIELTVQFTESPEERILWF